tara:strand:+ start:42 stop:248 length:207 start_codon:yes stop_codon:yes gene_type:complete
MSKETKRFERITQMDFSEYWQQEKPREMSGGEARLEYLRIKTTNYILRSGTDGLEKFVKKTLDQMNQK